MSKINIEFIKDIDDDITRRVFYNRCVKHEKWAGVALVVGISECSAKMMFYRYLDKHSHLIREDNV
jgi:hypothetical protein